MDSLTQILLGAAVGEVTLGKQVGNKAILWGAIAGTIPDLDVISGFFVDDLTKNEWHRGLSHSLVFHLALAPILARVVHWIHRKSKVQASVREWRRHLFWCLFTHALLDAHTSWGTQLLWPLPWKFSWNNIFVADPLYTTPLLLSFLLILFIRRGSTWRYTINTLGLVLSSVYMAFTLVCKGIVHHRFSEALSSQGIDHEGISTRPTPLNCILWNANVELVDAYLIGEYSLFDSSPIRFTRIPKNHHLIGHLEEHDKVQRLYRLTEGEYAVRLVNDTLVYNDLRFGMFGEAEEEGDFVFAYQLIPNGDDIEVHEIPPPRPEGEEFEKVLSQLMTRIKGN